MHFVCVSTHGPHLNEVGEFLVPSGHNSVHLVLNFVLLRVRERHVILGEARPSLAVLQKNELYHD